MPSAPSAPDPNLIAQLANYFFRTPPDGPIPTQDSPGMPLVPPSPNMAPAPSVVTSAAPLIPAALPFGPPDFPPTTIASVVPTPNISAPTTPAAPHGLPDVPQPGSTAGGFAPNAPGDLDAAGPLAHLAEFTSFVPKEHLASAFGAQDLTPSPFNTPPKDSPYFLDDNALARRDLDLAAVPAAPTPSVSPSLPDPTPAGRLPDAPGISPQIPQGADASIPSARPAAPELPQSFGWPSAAAPQTPQAPVNIPHVPDSPGVPDAHVPGEAFYFLGPAKSAAASEQRRRMAPQLPPRLCRRPQASHRRSLHWKQRPPPSTLALRRGPSTPIRSSATSRSCRRRSTASRSSGSTTPRRRRSRRAVIDRLSYFYEHENSNIHRAAHDARRARHRCLRGARARRSRAFSTPAPSQRHRLCSRRHRGDQPRRPELGRPQHQGRRRDRHHLARAPRQYRSLAAALRRRRARSCASRRSTIAGRSCSRSIEKLLGPRTRLVAFTQVSNALGTSCRSREMIGDRPPPRRAACWSMAPRPSRTCRSTCRSSTATSSSSPATRSSARPASACVYGKPDVLAQMPPWQGGGNMIADVTFEKTIYQAPPGRFEAGTGNIADAVGLGAAIDYVERIGMREHRPLRARAAGLRDRAAADSSGPAP